MRRLVIALALMLLALLGLAAPASLVAASAPPTIATYGYDREHDIDGTDHTAPARGSLQHVPVDVSAGHRPGGDHGSHASLSRSGAVNHARSAYGYDSPVASTTQLANTRNAARIARPAPPASLWGVRIVSGCCIATKAGSGAGRSTRFVTTPRGTTFDIPKGWAAREAENGRGIVYQRPGAPGNADSIRIMEPTEQYPNGYFRYYNSEGRGQPLDVNGKPGSPGATHHHEDFTGPLQGWPR